MSKVHNGLWRSHLTACKHLVWQMDRPTVSPSCNVPERGTLRTTGAARCPTAASVDSRVGGLTLDFNTDYVIKYLNGFSVSIG